MQNGHVLQDRSSVVRDDHLSSASLDLQPNVSSDPFRPSIQTTHHLVHSLWSQTRTDSIRYSCTVSRLATFDNAHTSSPFAAFMLDNLTSVGLPCAPSASSLFAGLNQLTLSLNCESEIPVGAADAAAAMLNIGMRG